VSGPSPITGSSHAAGSAQSGVGRSVLLANRSGKIWYIVPVAQAGGFSNVLIRKSAASATSRPCRPVPFSHW